MKNILIILTLLAFTSPTIAQTRNLQLVKPPIENPTNEKRKAVVIGMGDYGSHGSLPNTINDADDMATVFTQLGFEVTLLKNNDMQNLETNLDAWYNTIEKNDMAIFYFAGHGMEVGNINYVIPVDAAITSLSDVKHKTLCVNTVLENMDKKGVTFKLLILDACRDNPFRSWNRSSSETGLAQMNAPKGMLIAFAAEPGEQAMDGGNYNLKNGVFTHYFKQEVLKEGITIDNILNKVAGRVAELTDDRQLPYKTGILTDDFYFIPRKNNSPTNAVVNVTELFSQANTHYNNERYEDAVPLFRQAAEQGYTRAQYYLGNCYYHGYGVTKDYNQAVEWLRLAVEKDNASAQNLLGLCYRNGNGVAKDEKIAVEWYSKAAEQGNSTAQNNLGYCYYNGYGVTKDYDQAVQWYTKSAEKGNSSAQYRLGYCYYNGNGVTKDYYQAVEWYTKAAEQGETDAQYSLGNCFYYGYGVTKDYNQAVEWLRKAVEKDNASAQNLLGLCYRNGNGVAKDEKIAVEWYSKAAEQGNATAQNNLGYCYYNGYGVTKDYDQAVQWYTKSAEKGNSSAQYRLGYCYYNGNGVTKDYKQAVEWFTKSAEKGDVNAQYNLGRCFYNGDGVTQDTDQAILWYKKAADQGNEDAKNKLKDIGIEYP